MKIIKNMALTMLVLLAFIGSVSEVRAQNDRVAEKPRQTAIEMIQPGRGFGCGGGHKYVMRDGIAKCENTIKKDDWSGLDGKTVDVYFACLWGQVVCRGMTLQFSGNQITAKTTSPFFNHTCTLSGPGECNFVYLGALTTTDKNGQALSVAALSSQVQTGDFAVLQPHVTPRAYGLNSLKMNEDKSITLSYIHIGGWADCYSSNPACYYGTSWSTLGASDFDELARSGGSIRISNWKRDR